MAHAALWQAEQMIILGSRYDTNLAMTINNAVETRGADILWSGELERTTTTSSLNSELEFKSRKRNAGEGFYDSDDQKGGIEYTKKWHKSGYNLNLDFIRDNTLATEILLTTFRPFNTHKRREKISLDAQVYVEVSPLDTWVINYSFGETQYRDSGLLLYQLNDFTQTFFRFNWQRLITENLTSQFAAFQFDTDVLDFTNDSITRAVEIGFVYSISDVSTLNALVGVRHTSTVSSLQNIKNSTEGNGNIFQLDYTYQRSTSNFTLGVSRKMEPDYSSGRLLEKTRASMSYNQQWRDKLVISFTSSLVREKPESTNLTSSLQSSQNKFSIRKRITENMKVSFSYQYLEREFLDFENHDTKGNIYMISLIYKDKPKFISR